MRHWFTRLFADTGASFLQATALAYMSLAADQAGAEAPISPHPTTDSPWRPAQGHSHRTRRAAAVAVGECEAFLTGCYHQVLVRSHQTFFDWAWINPLAHADCAELGHLANLTPTRRSPLALLSYLADEVLLRAGHDDTALKQLQHETLIPLELFLLAHPTHINDPIDLAKIIEHQLAALPTTRHPKVSRHVKPA